MSSKPTEDSITLPSIVIDIDVPFFDVDIMEVVWHGHYVKYFEMARAALFETFNYNYREMRASGYAWPVIELKIRYARPAQLGQKIHVKAWLVEYEQRLKTAYLITDAKTGERLTKAHTIQAAVDMSKNELMYSTPKILLEKLGIKT